MKKSSQAIHVEFAPGGTSNIGRKESQGKTPQEIQKAIGQFAVKYGLLGLMTALPTTSTVMDYVMMALAMTMSDKPIAVLRRLIVLLCLTSRRLSGISTPLCLEFK